MDTVSDYSHPSKSLMSQVNPQHLTLAVSQYLKLSPKLKSEFIELLAYSYYHDRSQGIHEPMTITPGMMSSLIVTDLPPSKQQLLIDYVNYIIHTH